MNERELFEEWHNSDIPQFNGELRHCDVDMRLFDAWEACAESKQAEIADIHKHYAEEAWNLAGETSELIGKLAQANEELDKANARIAQLEGVARTAEEWQAIAQPINSELLSDIAEYSNTESSLNARIAQLEDALKAMVYGSINFNPTFNALNALAPTSANTWQSKHDRAVETRVLEAVLIMHDKPHWNFQTYLKNMIAERQPK